ncbi:MAG: hypothetical protein KGI55_08000, partial [Gammaproteobacteria bacterium]|nr:hypothetical protein [Gammaproteobacteria bacterium]
MSRDAQARALEALDPRLRAAFDLWLDRARSQPWFAAADARLSERHRGELVRVIACSEFVGNGLIADPQALEGLDLHDEAGPAAAANSEAERAAAAAAPDQAETL